MSGSAPDAREPVRSGPEAAPDSSGPEAAPEPNTTPPSPDLGAVEAESVLPGGHRGGFQRLPTGPIGVTSQSAPRDPDGAPVPQWAMPEPAAPQRGLSAWALGFSIVGLVVSLFVGWGFPLGLAGIVAGILALRRPIESRAVAVWAIVLGGVSILYSAGWLLLAAARADLLG